jgi:hypothetical protein
MVKMNFILDYSPDAAEGTLDIRLALQPSEDDNGFVDLVNLDHEGEVEQYVMTFKIDGTFYRHDHGNYVTSEATDDNPNNFLVECGDMDDE